MVARAYPAPPIVRSPSAPVIRAALAALAILAVWLPGCALYGPGPIGLSARESSGRSSQADVRMDEVGLDRGRRVLLVRRHSHEREYLQSQQIWLGTVIGRGIVIREGSRLRVTPRADGSYEEHARVERSWAQGQAFFLNPGPVAATLVGTRMRVQVGPANLPVGPVVVQSQGADSLLLETFRTAFATYRVPYPSAPLRAGDRWTGEPAVLELRRSGGWIRADFEPTFAYDGLVQEGRERYARIRWSGPVYVHPFSQIGPTYEGRGRVWGTTLIDLRDGFAGKTDLSSSVGLVNAGAPADAPAAVQAQLRYVSTVVRAAGGR